MAEWAFITNHARVLGWLSRHPRITALEISTQVGITERATRKIIADLEAYGYITKKREGRRVKYHINPEKPVESQTAQDIAIGDFLRTMGWYRRRRRKQAIKPEETVSKSE